MGSIDTLRFQCPKCKETTSYQSKIGERDLEEFTLESAPLLVIADVNDEGVRDRLYCEHCGAKLRVDVQFAASVRLANGNDDEDYWREC